MATAADFATVDWAYMLDDPAEPGTKKSAEWMLGHARWDAWNAFQAASASSAKLDALAKQVEDLTAYVKGLEIPGGSGKWLLEGSLTPET